MTRRSLVGYVILVAVLGGALALLSRPWTYKAPHPAILIATASLEWKDESPWVNEAGVWKSPLPNLAARMNSEAFLQEVKSSLSSHPIVESWTTDNTRFEPSLLSPGGPLVVHCYTLGYGHRTWTWWGLRGASLDMEKADLLEHDFEQAIQRLVKTLASSS